ncbi:Uncharacterised protein [Chlamydia abortus]|nr:Uncharacterised protein [Chlamydia abortus]SFW01439.1 Uncharacterised protein [Chlamydia abortus]SFW03941.1 Uncharacterised protein [Chlamydia abortus]SFW09268.1 Uncharacterised protein [Chlamydia abortus]SFW09837.1 Uncharacterised protein [Chlamydia abortus]
MDFFFCMFFTLWSHVSTLTMILEPIACMPQIASELVSMGSECSIMLEGDSEAENSRLS